MKELGDGVDEMNALCPVLLCRTVAAFTTTSVPSTFRTFSCRAHSFKRAQKPPQVFCLCHSVIDCCAALVCCVSVVVLVALVVFVALVVLLVLLVLLVASGCWLRTGQAGVGFAPSGYGQVIDWGYSNNGQFPVDMVRRRYLFIMPTARSVY
jgi:hypothetical protein